MHFCLLQKGGGCAGRKEKRERGRERQWKKETERRRLELKAPGLLLLFPRSVSWVPGNLEARVLLFVPWRKEKRRRRAVFHR